MIRRAGQFIKDSRLDACRKKPRLFSRAGACSGIASLLKKGATLGDSPKINRSYDQSLSIITGIQRGCLFNFAHIQGVPIQVWTDEGNERMKGTKA